MVKLQRNQPGFGMDGATRTSDLLVAFFTNASVDFTSILTPNFDWEGLIALASSERLLPALADRVRTLNIQALLPEEIVHVLADAEAMNGERTRIILGEAVYVASLLNEIGITPAALKGIAYLLSGVYPLPASRYLIDIDLLIPASQIPQAALHLQSHGFFEDATDVLASLRHHYPGMHRAGLPNVELHHSVGIGICNRLLRAERILSEATAMTYGGARFLIPSPTALVNHLILHSQLAHPYSERVFPPIRALYDLCQIQKRFSASIDWASLSTSYRSVEQSATLELHLLQAKRLVAFPADHSAFRGQTSDTSAIPFWLKVRLEHRLLLSRYKDLRFVDPIYMTMSMFSRRWRIISRLMREPRAFLRVIGRLTSVQFYRNLFNF